MRYWESVLFWLLLLVVLLSPLPFGSNRPLPASILFAAVGLILLAWGVGVLVSAVQPTVPARAVWPALVLFGAAAAWAAVQATPLTPEAWHHPFWAEARAVLLDRVPVQGAISASPGETWTRLTGLLAYGAIFWLALQFCRSPERAGRVLLGCAAAGLLYALYGLYNYFSGAEKILWLDKWIGRGTVTGTFVNRNSYATYAGMTLFCCLGLCVRGVLRQGRRHATLGRVVVELFGSANLPLLVGSLGVLLSGTALLLTQSRGAFGAAAVALVVFILTLRRTRGGMSVRLYVVLAAVIAGFFLAMLQVSGERTLDRFAAPEGTSLGQRLVFYRTTWEAIGDRPLLGTGYGTYADVFKAYNHASTGSFFVDKAHNTYLQLVMELGWPATLALFTAVLLLAVRCFRGLRERQHGGGVELAVVVACSVLVGLHALVDFSLEMPANAATYALLLGMGCAQSWSRRRYAVPDVPSGAGAAAWPSAAPAAGGRPLRPPAIRPRVPAAAAAPAAPAPRAAASARPG